MPLKPLDAPCWRLTDKTGADYDYDDGPAHFATKETADRYATDSLLADPGSLTPKQWDKPCLLAFCDGCGAEFDDGVWAHTHFPDEKTAYESVGLYDDYRVEPETDGTRMFCPDCPAADDEDDD